MKKNLSLFFIFSYFITIKTTPVVEFVLPGMLGNKLFGFCIGKIVAEELGFDFYCKPILGFPNTYLYTKNKPSNKYPTERFMMGENVGEHEIDIKSITSNHKKRNIWMHGYFQRYKYIQPYKNKIKNDWFKLDPAMMYEQDPEDIVLHIRTSHGPLVLPVEYYEKALSITTFKRLFICTNDPNDPDFKPFLERLKKYNPIVHSTRSLRQMMHANVSWDTISEINTDEFYFILSFNKIVSSHSTFSWWAAFLSDAQEIYMPYDPNTRFHTYGNVDEARYHYIQTTIGKN